MRSCDSSKLRQGYGCKKLTSSNLNLVCIYANPCKSYGKVVQKLYPQIV